MAPVAGSTRDAASTLSVETFGSVDISPPRFRPSQTQVGPERSDSAKSRDAAGGLSDHRASLQSAVDITETDDGE
jgi:hypothetical protein